MAVFIAVSTDPFSEAFANARSRQPQINVRRPLRGITVKENTYAVLRVLDASSNPIPMFDSSSPDVSNGIGTSSHYANFIIQQFQEQRMEKQQIVETFGDDYIFFFGERPRFINIGGILLNTKDFNWKSEFWENYERYLRGTKLVENNARLYLYFDDIVVEGYIVSASTTQDASSPHHLPFQFQMFVTNYAILSNVGSVFFQDEANAFDSLIGGLAAESPVGQPATAESVARKSAAGGGLNSFLAGAAKLSADISFSIQSTLESVKNTFYGRRIVFPEGVGQTIHQAPIQNLATFTATDNVGRPIHEMNDEYPERGDNAASFDRAEVLRVNAELALRDPVALEVRARAELYKMGIDTTRRDPSYLLLGRGAFAAAQYMGAFGIRRADGNLLDSALDGASINLP